jgi:hypothetical protein
MKNIHVLQTDKPSRLIHNVLGYGMVTNEFTKSDLQLIQAEYQNIYITSDEEIKDEDWVIERSLNWVFKIHKHGLPNYNPNKKKIILTTDQDLIKDGVQAIPDDFLEWFVKNPSCEEVEIENSEKYTFQHRTDDFKEIVYIDNSIEIDRVKKTSTKNWNSLENKFIYKIIIPKEEPKTNLEKLPFPELVKEFAEYYKNVPLVEEPKQETLEEAAETISDYIKRVSTSANESVGIMKGIKWQQERSYSEEEVKAIVNKVRETGLTVEYLLLTEQFKKK